MRFYGRLLEGGAIRNQDLRRVIEEPSEEIGRHIEKGWEDGGEREIRDANADITAHKKSEAEHGEKCGAAIGFVAMPAPADDEIHEDGSEIEGANDKDKWDELQPEVESDDDNNGGDEDT